MGNNTCSVKRYSATMSPRIKNSVENWKRNNLNVKKFEKIHVQTVSWLVRTAHVTTFSRYIFHKSVYYIEMEKKSTVVSWERIQKKKKNKMDSSKEFHFYHRNKAWNCDFFTTRV